MHMSDATSHVLSLNSASVFCEGSFLRFGDPSSVALSEGYMHIASASTLVHLVASTTA